MLHHGYLGERAMVKLDIAHFWRLLAVPYLFAFKATWGADLLPRLVPLFIHYFYAP